jgi:hypothetical protein
MALAKRTYALPHEAVAKFEAMVGPGRRSARIAEMIEAWTAEREREALRRDVIEGCKEMGAIYLDMAHEWEPLEEEVARAFDE